MLIGAARPSVWACWSMTNAPEDWPIALWIHATLRRIRHRPAVAWAPGPRPGPGPALALILPILAAEASEEAELRDLLTLLDRQTELATRTGLNADFIPAMATILSGDDLLLRGARTVWEALSLVPGISQGLEVTGERQVLSRGVGHGCASGNVKILLDGVSMNSTHGHRQCRAQPAHRAG